MNGNFEIERHERAEAAAVAVRAEARARAEAAREAVAGELAEASREYCQAWPWPSEAVGRIQSLVAECGARAWEHAAELAHERAHREHVAAYEARRELETENRRSARRAVPQEA